MQLQRKLLTDKWTNGHCENSIHKILVAIDLPVVDTSGVRVVPGWLTGVDEGDIIVVTSPAVVVEDFATSVVDIIVVAKTKNVFN